MAFRIYVEVPAIELYRLFFYIHILHVFIYICTYVYYGVQEVRVARSRGPRNTPWAQSPIDRQLSVYPVLGLKAR
jgi:hypothetical protein